MQGRLSSSHANTNPHVAECDSMLELVSEEIVILSELSAQIEHHEGEKLKWKAVEKAFGREGISSFALEGVLLELQVHLSNASMLQACDGMSMLAINRQFCPRPSHCIKGEVAWLCKTRVLVWSGTYSGSFLVLVVCG